MFLILGQMNAEPDDFYKKRHKELLTKFDINSDGFLDAGEREKMRVTPKPQGNQFRRGGEKEVKKRVRRDMPQHWIEKYDKDGDGGLSDKEADKGYWTERSHLFKAYDLNQNKKLEKNEITHLGKDIEDGKFESWDHFVATTTLKDSTKEDKSESFNLSDQQQQWIKHDRDKDGIASKEEIAAIRKSIN